jgi:hypothetical protein
MPVLVGFVAFVIFGVLQAENLDRSEIVRGLFICVTEAKVGDKVYTGIVVKPFDRDNHMLVLIPDNRKEFIQTTHKLKQGTRLEISFVSEEGLNFIRSIKAELKREIRGDGFEDDKQVIVRREVRRETSDYERSENKRSRGARREPGRPLERENHENRKPTAQLDQLQRQFREVVSGHLDRMSRSLREVLADHLWRMDAEFRDLRARVDRIERELDRLRADNEQLRRELRERNSSRGERKDPVRERKGDRERTEHDSRRNREEM